MSRKKHLCFILLLMTVTILSWIPLRGHAATGNDVSNNVTSITVSPTDVKDGDKVSVNFNFDETLENIQPGDYINIAWTNSGTVFAQGYNKTLDLVISGKTVGSMDIRLDGAQVVFNDNIKNLDEVKGWGKFDILARNVSSGNAENTGSLTVSTGGKTATLNVTKPATSSGPSVFYYKTGDMLPQDTQHVRWFLNINNDRVEVTGDVTVKDQIQLGQRLDPSTFIFRVTDNSGTKEYYGESGLATLISEYPGVSVSYSSVDNKIDLYIPASVARYRFIGVNYKTVIEDSQQASFDNKSQAWYQEYNQPAVVGDSFDHSVQNINASGGIQGTVKGQLKIVKTVDGTDIGIPNVKFTLKRADGQDIQGETSVVLTTDANGETGIKGLAVGDYLLQETFAPDWIDFDPLVSPERKFTISENDTQGVDLSIYNQKKTTSVSAKKVWLGGLTPRPTIYFKLYRTNLTGTKEEVPGAGLKKLVDGTSEVTWSDIPAYDDQGGAYDFTVQEVDGSGNDSTPVGYSKNETGLLVTNTNVEQVSVTGHKTWDDANNQDGKRPTSITVNLLANGKEVQEKTVTEADGWDYAFTQLPKYEAGQEISYTVSEDSVAGYTTAINGFDITNTQTPETTQVTGHKTWDDANNQDGKRPTSITVNLLANGKEVQEKTVTEADGWDYAFTQLPKYEAGQEISYTVSEDSVAGYTTAINGFDITNTQTPETTQVTGHKTWNDVDNQEGKRPTSITVNLLANGKEVQEKTVTEAEGWDYAFTQLPKYEAGQEITYTITEDMVEGYTTEINGFNIINTHRVETTNNSGPKNDGNIAIPEDDGKKYTKKDTKVDIHTVTKTKTERKEKVASKDDVKSLPDTGEENKTILMYVGGAFLILGAALYVYKVKKQHY